MHWHMELYGIKCTLVNVKNCHNAFVVVLPYCKRKLHANLVD